MSTNGVILQHGAELFAYLFVDRSDNLFVGKYTKSLFLTTGDCNWENTAISLARFRRFAGVNISKYLKIRCQT